MPIQIAAQLYTLREYTKTLKDFAECMRKVRQLGYSAVQVSAIGPMPPADVARVLKDNDLTCCATHASLDQLKKDPRPVIDELKTLGCQYTSIGGFFPKDPTVEDWHRFAQEYNQIAKAFTGTGIRLGYHNHSHELVKYGNTTALQMLIQQLDPCIFFEIDTYWITHGGGDPAAWIRKLSGRIPCVHLKDMGINKDGQHYMMEVGEGNLDWPGILQACKAAGVQWHIIEQDVCYRDPYESLGISLKNLQAMVG